MKHILVPTDFSDCAGRALDAALLLAKKTTASIHLYSCLNIPANWADLSKEEQEKNQRARELIKSTESAFDAIIAKNPDMVITASYSAGKLLNQIKTCIEKRAIDFVVMGSYGKSGVSELFVGSNTQKVVRLIHCPVLIIKQEVKDINFKKVVFTSSFNLSEKEPFLKFKEWISIFESEILLLGIKTSFFFDPPAEVIHSAMEDFKKLAKPLACEIYIFKNPNIESSIREFSEEFGADLIAISNHNRHPLKRMLAGSNVETLINHSNLPVLSIDY